MTTTRFDSGDPTVDAALAEMAATNPATADRAADAFTALTWGRGLPAVSLRSLQDYLWYQLPYKHGHPPDDQRATTDALAALFDRLGLHRYADTCRGSATDKVLAAYAADDHAGLTAYRKALTSGGVEPPDLPDLLTWGGVLGVEEHAAFWTVADHLEQAIDAGVYTPGGAGWRAAAARTAAEVLTVPRLDLHGDTYLTRIHTERRDRWAHSRGPTRAGLTEQVLPLLVDDPPTPDDAEQHLTQIRWFLNQCDGDGAPLTVNHTLSRALLTEASHRFNWLILGKQAPPENQLPEAHHLRGIADQLGATRRRGRRLLLTTRGQHLLGADTATLWAAVTAALIPTEPAEAAAAEIMLMQLLTGPPPRYDDSPIVADALNGEGWTTDDGPLSRGYTGWLTGPLFGRLAFLGLQGKPSLTGRSPLTPTGRAAAVHALRHRSQAPLSGSDARPSSLSGRRSRGPLFCPRPAPQPVSEVVATLTSSHTGRPGDSIVATMAERGRKSWTTPTPRPCPLRHRCPPPLSTGPTRPAATAGT